MSQFKNFINKETERKLPPSIEEQSRKNKFPEICSDQCPHKTCGYHTQENYGKACQMQFSQYENEKMQPNSKPNPNQELLRTTFEEKLTKALRKALQPTIERLDAIEAQDRKVVTRSFFNGTRIPFRVDENLNQKNFNYD